MADITKIKVNGTEYEIAGSGGGEQKLFKVGYEEGDTYAATCCIKFETTPTYNNDYDFKSVNSYTGLGSKLDINNAGCTTSKTIYAWAGTFVKINGVQYNLSSSNTWDNPLKIELTEYPYEIILSVETSSGGAGSE